MRTLRYVAGMWGLALALALLLYPALLLAAEGDPADAAGEATEAYASDQDFLDSLQYQTGIIELPNGVATLTVPASMLYLDPENAQRFLEEGWGNPDGSGTLGMLLPFGTDLFDAEGWGVIVYYQEDGHVSDKDADEIDYDDLLHSMQESVMERNEQRVADGYQPIRLVGWAAAPHYDQQVKKLYWAKDLQFGDDEVRTLNYNVRILGRNGVLIMNAVSDMPMLSVIQGKMREVTAGAGFKDGYRYADYDPGVDKVAAYGLAALIGGTVATKVGLFAKIGAVLLGMKKFILIGLVAIGGVFTRIFKSRKSKTPPSGDA